MKLYLDSKSFSRYSRTIFRRFSATDRFESPKYFSQVAHFQIFWSSLGLTVPDCEDKNEGKRVITLSHSHSYSAKKHSGALATLFPRRGWCSPPLPRIRDLGTWRHFCPERRWSLCRFYGRYTYWGALLLKYNNYNYNQVSIFRE